MYIEKDLKAELYDIAFCPSTMMLINIGAIKYSSTFKAKAITKKNPQPDVE